MRCITIGTVLILAGSVLAIWCSKSRADGGTCQYAECNPNTVDCTSVELPQGASDKGCYGVTDPTQCAGRDCYRCINGPPESYRFCRQNPALGKNGCSWQSALRCGEVVKTSCQFSGGSCLCLIGGNNTHAACNALICGQ